MGGTRARFIAAAVLLTCSMTVVVGALTAPPAGATGNRCGWTTQSQMADSVAPCRSGFVLDPGAGNLMSRSQLIDAAGLYEAEGFTPNFLWYAPDEQLQLSAGNPTQWTDCAIGGVEYTGPTPCPSPADVVPPADGHTIDGWDFNDATVTLDTWSWPPPTGCSSCQAPSSIFKVCGNYVVAGDGSSNPPGGPSPVPTIAGSKYSDLNSDGVREPGEPGVAAWPMTLTRVSSYFQDQPTGYVTTVYTDADGNYSIALDGIGPGTYEITEGSEQYWHPETGTTRTVVVAPGIGDATIAVPAFGNHYNLPPVAVIAPVPPTDQTSAAGAQVTLDGSASYDPDGSIVSWTWTGPFGTATGPTPLVTMPPGTSTVTLTVCDGERTDTTSTEVTVYPPITAQALPLTGTEGSSIAGTVATFADPDPDAQASEYVAAVDWGDGSSPSQDVTLVQNADGTFSVEGTHTYAEEAGYSPIVTITDVDNPFNTATVVDAATVGDAALQATGGNIATTNPLTDYPVATLADTNPYGTAADFTATIDWGDGEVAGGTVSGPTGGPFTVSGSHTYAALGFYTITVHIVDDGGQTAEATDRTITFEPGGFVVGDLTVGALAPGPVENGASITYWGSQWWKQNALSGGPAPASFKGYDDDPAVLQDGSTWSSGPGNSSMPPSTVPTYMAVVVSSSIAQAGSVISGDVVHVVIVRTDAGYEPDPGHIGTGTVVWEIS